MTAAIEVDSARSVEITKGSGLPAPDDDQVPVFGTWRRIYATVILSALAAMGLIGLFSAWPY